MKRNDNFVLRNIAGETILVPTGELSMNFNGLITLNEVASFIWENINDCDKSQDLIKKVLEVYDVSEEQAKDDVEGMIYILSQNGMIEL